jgi:hypothetical protein
MKKLEIHIEMENGDAFDVTTKTTDYLLWEETAKKHRWGSFSDSPARWEAFLAWAALKRVGKYEGPWEQFIKQDVDMVEATPVKVEPTNEEVGDASSLS